MKKVFYKIKAKLGRLSFRTGVVLALMCLLCYVISFAQMLLPLSVTVKGVLWAVFFGLAKTFQYSAIAVLGTTGVSRLRQWFRSRRSNPPSQQN